jgi:type 1 glutamine amidotransferase
MMNPLAVLLLLSVQAAKPTPEEVAKIEAALPGPAPATPARPRKLLVVGSDPWHDPVPYCSKTMELLGKKTGAFQAVVTDDGSFFEPEKLQEFDGVLVNNWHGFNPFLPVAKKEFDALPAGKKDDLRKREARLRKSLLDFVAGGKGLVGIHAATVGLGDWKEYYEMIGGKYRALPYFEADVRIDVPGHPVNAAFEGRGFRIADEFYELGEPYSREKLKVLISVDWEKMKDVEKSTKYGKPVRTDGDYGLSWVKPHGKGRVFYCALGHFSSTYWNPAILKHWLAGIQYALGDLPE